MIDFATSAERYLILVEGGPPSNYSAWSPDLIGCVATGAGVEACVAAMHDAIVLHLQGMAEDGDAIPAPSGPGVYVARQATAA